MKTNSQQLRQQRGGASMSSTDGGDSDEEPWDARQHSQSETEDSDDGGGRSSGVNNINTSRRKNNQNMLPSLHMDRSDDGEESEMSNIQNNYSSNNNNSHRRKSGGVLTTGQRTMRPLSPPATAGMPGQYQNRSRVQDRYDADDIDDEDDDDDDMPMDERLDYQRRIAEALCSEEIANDVAGETNLCAYTLTKMGEICAGKTAVRSSPPRSERSVNENEIENATIPTKEINGKQDIPEGVDELTAIEVEYVEPVGRPPPRNVGMEPKGRLSPGSEKNPNVSTTPPISPIRKQQSTTPTRNLGLLGQALSSFTGDPYRERADTARSPGRRGSSASSKAKSPKRKSALLSAMTKRAKEDFEKGKPQQTSSALSSGEPPSSSSVEREAPVTAGGENGYASFNQSEKRKFLKLINSGLTPSEATTRVVEERQSGEAAMEQVGEVSSKNSKGRLSFWNKKKEGDIPKEVSPEDTPTEPPMTPKTEIESDVQDDNDDDDDDGDDLRFARSGIGYYDADRKDNGDSMEVEDEEEMNEEAALAARRGSNTNTSSRKKSFLLPKFVRKGFTPLDKDGKPVEKRKSRLSAIGGSLRGQLSPRKVDEDNDHTHEIISPKSVTQDTHEETPDRALTEPAEDLEIPTLTSPPQTSSLASKSRNLPQDAEISKSRALPQDSGVAYSPPSLPPQQAVEPAAEVEESKPDTMFRPIPLQADNDRGVPSLTQTFSDESLLNDDNQDHMHEEKKEEISAASSMAGSAEIEDVITAQLLGRSIDRSVDTVETNEGPTVYEEPELDADPSIPAIPEKENSNLELEDMEMDVDVYFNSTELLSNLSGGNHHDLMSVVSSKSQKTSATGRTGLSHGTNYTTSSRRRHHGAASRRLAAAKYAEGKQKKSYGWQQSIEAAAANANRVWDPEKGWVDYVDPNAVVEKGEDSVIRPEEKIHIPLDRVIRKPRSKEEQQEESVQGKAQRSDMLQTTQDHDRNVALQSTQELDRAVGVVSTPPRVEQSKDNYPMEQHRAVGVVSTPPTAAPDKDSYPMEHASPQRPDFQSQNIPAPQSALQSQPDLQSRNPRAPQSVLQSQTDLQSRNPPAAHQSTSQSPSTPPRRAQQNREVASSPKRATPARQPSSRNSKTPPRSRGWVESMKAATANLAKSDTHWDPERGWVGIDDDEEEVISHEVSSQNRYGGSLSVQADSDTQDFGMAVTTPLREQDLGHGQGMNAAIVTPTPPPQERGSTAQYPVEHTTESFAVTRTMPDSPPEVAPKLEQNTSTMSGKDEHSVDSTDQSRGASIRSGRSGRSDRYMQIGETGSVRSHYRNPAHVAKKPQPQDMSQETTDVSGATIEEEKEEPLAQPGTVDVIKEKVSPEDAGMFPKVERSSGPVDLDDIYDEEHGSFDAPPTDFSWDQEMPLQSGDSQDKQPPLTARQMNPVPKIRINVRETNKGGQDGLLSSKSTDSHSIGVTSSADKPIPKLRGPKRDTSPIRARRSRSSSSKASPQSPEVVPIEKPQQRPASLAKNEESPPPVPTRQSVQSHSEVDTSYESEGTHITPVQHFSSDSGDDRKEAGHFPILGRSNLEREHFQHISPPSSSEEGDNHVTSTYPILPPEVNRVHGDVTAQRGPIPDNQGWDRDFRGAPHAESSSVIRAHQNVGSPGEKIGHTPTAPLSPMQVPITPTKSLDESSFVSTDSRRSSVRMRAEFWESQAKSPKKSPESMEKKEDTLQSPHVAAEWNSFLAKKVKAEAEAANHQQKRFSKGGEEDRDSLFDFPESEGAFPTSGRSSGKRVSPGAANPPQARGYAEEPEAEAFRDISDLSPIRVQHEDDEAERFSETSSAAVQPSSSSTFLQRLQACAGPIVPRKTNGDADCNAVPLAHLAFLRTNPSLNGTPEKQRSSRFAPPNICGRPDVIVEEDENEEADTSYETSRDRSFESGKHSRSRSNPKPSKHSDVGSVISEEAFGAKTAYLEAIAMKTAVSGSKKKRRSTGSDISGASSRHSEKWQRFLETKGSKSTASSGEKGSKDEVSRAAEKYAAEKVEEMMEIMAQRRKAPFQSRPMEEATGAFPSVENSRSTNPKNAGRKPEASRAAEDLAAARVEAMMHAMSSQHNMEEGNMEEGEI